MQKEYVCYTFYTCASCRQQLENILAEGVITPIFIDGCNITTGWLHNRGSFVVGLLRCRDLGSNPMIPKLKLTNSSRRALLNNKPKK